VVSQSAAKKVAVDMRQFDRVESAQRSLEH